MGEYTNMAQSMIRTIAGAGYMRHRMDAADEANEIAQQQLESDMEPIEAGARGGDLDVPQLAANDAGKMAKADARLTKTNAFSMVDRLKRYSGMRTAQSQNRELIRGGKPIGDVPMFHQFGQGGGSYGRQ